MNRYLEEILDQPDALIRVIDHFPTDVDVFNKIPEKIQSGKIRHIVLTGMGASLYSCYPLWLTLSNFGLPVSLWDTSELINYAPNLLDNRTFMIVVSQSGESAEIKRLTSLEKNIGLKIGVTNQSDSNLAHWADITLGLYAEEETAVSTKTYLNSLAVLHIIGSLVTGEKLDIPKQSLYSISTQVCSLLSELTHQTDDLMKFLNATEKLIVLGRGYSLGSAMYSSLILNEASKLYSFALSAAQFRHGPLEIVRQGFKAIIFSGGELTHMLNLKIAQEIAKLGGKMIFITTNLNNKFPASVKELNITDVDYKMLPFLEILPVQLLTLPLAKAQGFDANVFLHSNKITGIE